MYKSKTALLINTWRIWIWRFPCSCPWSPGFGGRPYQSIPCSRQDWQGKQETSNPRAPPGSHQTCPDSPQQTRAPLSWKSGAVSAIRCPVCSTPCWSVHPQRVLLAGFPPGSGSLGRGKALRWSRPSLTLEKLNKISRQHYWKPDCVNQSYQENHMSLIIHIVCPCVLSSLIVQLLINILVGSRFLRYVLVILSDTLGFFCIYLNFVNLFGTMFTW